MALTGLLASIGTRVFLSRVFTCLNQLKAIKDKVCQNYGSLLTINGPSQRVTGTGKCFQVLIAMA